jgi:hypothetical protein
MADEIVEARLELGFGAQDGAQRRLLDLAPLVGALLVHPESELLRHVAVQRPVGGQFAFVALVAPVIDLQQRVDRLVEEVGALVGQRAVVEMDDQQQAHHQRAVDQRGGVLAQALAAIGLEPPDSGQQVVGALVAAHGVLRVDAGVGLTHHRRDVLRVVERLHGDLAKIGARARCRRCGRRSSGR